MACNLTRSRALGLGLALVSLVSACSRSSGTSPLPSSTSTPTAAPTANGSPNALSSPCANTIGIAYEPDAGNGGAFSGIQVSHFEDNAQSLCGATPAPNATPPGVAFASSVGPFAVSADRSDAVAVLRGPGGGYTLAQDVFGASVGALVPAGSPYDLRANPPTPVPAATASPSATATPSNAPLLADVASLAILGNGSGGLALALGTPAAGSPPAIVALTSLANAPPQFGSAVPLGGTAYSLKTIPANPRSIVRVGSDTNQIVALARGPQDLVSFAVTIVGSGYQFDAKAVDPTLGSATALRGSGALAFDPQDSGRALVGGTTSAGGSVLTLVTGLPNAIVRAATLAMPATIRSIATTGNGTFGIVGTDAGIVVVKGVDSGTLSIVPPFAPTAATAGASVPLYRTCAGATAPLSQIYSVALSGDQRYLVALGTTPGLTCPSGYVASIVAVPFNVATGGTPTPAPSALPSPPSPATPLPTSFVQNNVIAPPAGADYFYAF
ncbi:MAG: hypothetical protein NVS2B3_06250 [Vulcanimicrobiaceae bacterium]